MRALTTSGRFKCTHGGLADCQSSQSLVYIQGHAVLVGGDPTARTFGSAGPACPVPTLPCLTTLVPALGHSAFVSINGVPVCLDTIAGLNQPSGGGYSVQDAGQALVEVGS
jgi:hypothetical protein